jgi:hypothetical protein
MVFAPRAKYRGLFTPASKLPGAALYYLPQPASWAGPALYYAFLCVNASIEMKSVETVRAGEAYVP